MLRNSYTGFCLGFILNSAYIVLVVLGSLDSGPAETNPFPQILLVVGAVIITLMLLLRAREMDRSPSKFLSVLWLLSGFAIGYYFWFGALPHFEASLVPVSFSDQLDILFPLLMVLLTVPITVLFSLGLRFSNNQSHKKKLDDELAETPAWTPKDEV